MPAAHRPLKSGRGCARQYTNELPDKGETGESVGECSDEEDIEESPSIWETEESGETSSGIEDLLDVESSEDHEDEESTRETSDEEEVGDVLEEDQICWRCRILREQVRYPLIAYFCTKD